MKQSVKHELQARSRRVDLCVRSTLQPFTFALIVFRLRNQQSSQKTLYFLLDFLTDKIITRQLLEQYRKESALSKTTSFRYFAEIKRDLMDTDEAKRPRQRDYTRKYKKSLKLVLDGK